ncbi:hypothetical protein Glove_110g108 [Diversispora epigaea]|uniref:Uncharacterized protein n=1 Tax=Diversispora epigaea TaxID=1348612 RepID=A0A397J480_9GLOM|nr:hypothetical protein Glove_110g108 [Diversispora epigaea]
MFAYLRISTNLSAYLCIIYKSPCLFEPKILPVFLHLTSICLTNSILSKHYLNLKIAYMLKGLNNKKLKEL